MTDMERRKHPRTEDRAIVGFGFLNQTPRYLGFVENTSAYGIQFISEKALPVGTLVTIQPWRCGIQPPEASSAESRRDADAICAGSHNATHRLNAMVIGKVVHCRRIEDRMPPAYAIGAHYEGSAV
ncbi:MAG: hypothetical protein QNI89_04595 [Desulfobacterales bacterium]|nr:hypothetical protein [Desulfobacterales bacterium]